MLFCGDGGVACRFRGDRRPLLTKSVLQPLFGDANLEGLLDGIVEGVGGTSYCNSVEISHCLVDPTSERPFQIEMDLIGGIPLISEILFRLHWIRDFGKGGTNDCFHVG